MKGLEKLTAIRLAEVLTEKGLVPTEAITDALYAQDKHGEPFVHVLVGGGHITEWDLSKIVAESFQLPFIMAGSLEVADEAKERLPKEVLFKNLIVPLDVFDNVVTVAMPILTPYEELSKLQRQHECDLFPYVGLTSENKKVLGEMFSDFNEWYKNDQERREQEANRGRGKKGGSKGDGGGWMDIFDAGDQAIKQDLGNRGGC